MSPQQVGEPKDTFGYLLYKLLQLLLDLDDSVGGLDVQKHCGFLTLDTDVHRLQHIACSS